MGRSKKNRERGNKIARDTRAKKAIQQDRGQIPFTSFYYII